MGRMDNPPLIGEVTNVVIDRGFGFIAGPDGTEFFFHHSGAPEFHLLTRGTKVRFVPTTTPKGPRAEQVSRI
jgi:cold shock CspA family protein